jgi:dihydroorotase
MKILIQSVYVISPGSPHHLSEKDLLIEDGLIKKAEPSSSIKEKDAEIINAKGLCISPGWFDLHANFSEPGSEYKEDIQSGSAAAAQGGFTGVLLMPTTEPSISGRPLIEFILKRSADSPVNLYASGTLSEKHEGKELSEMYDMYQAGANVFTDDKKAVHDSGLMMRALLYTKHFGGKIFSFGEEKYFSRNASVNEGVAAVTLGMKGIPAVAEEIMVSRDLMLAEYADSPIHISTISSAGSVDLIRKAKAKNIKVTCDVAAINLYCDETSLGDFDSNYKVKPPLRSSADRNALIDGLIDGTIDCICSDHIPQDVENKKKEFELAAFGASGLETAFGVARSATKNTLSLPELISKFTVHPRLCAGLKAQLIDANHTAELTLFNPDESWIVSEKNIKSKSRNNPFIGKSLIGRPVAIINKNTLVYCD